MIKLFDRVKVNIPTTGTGDIEFGAAASTAFLTPAEAGVLDGDEVRYVIVDGLDFEEGVGLIKDTVATMERTVTNSKIGGVVGTSALNLSGTAVLALTASAADILTPDDNLASLVDADAALGNLGGTTVGKAVFTAADAAAARSAIGVVQALGSQTFTTSGTFTTPANSTTATVYRYRMVGGGGGGGGCSNSGGAAGGGGAGAYAEGTFTGIAASTGISITIGAAGNGGTAGNTGGAGGASLLGAPVSITAGAGSGGMGITSATISLGGAAGVVTGSPTILSLAGGQGEPGVRDTGSVTVRAGRGGSSMLGYGGQPAMTAVAVNGSPGTGYGSGGGGGGMSATGLGGAGSAGVVIIDWVL